MFHGVAQLPCQFCQIPINLSIIGQISELPKSKSSKSTHPRTIFPIMEFFFAKLLLCSAHSNTAFPLANNAFPLANGLSFSCPMCQSFVLSTSEQTAQRAHARSWSILEKCHNQREWGNARDLRKKCPTRDTGCTPSWFQRKREYGVFFFLTLYSFGWSKWAHSVGVRQVEPSR